MELDLSQWTLESASSHSSSSDESSLQSTSIMLDQESLTQNGIDGAEILNGFRSFGNTGSHLPIDIVDVPPPAARPQQPATITPFRNTTNSTIDSYTQHESKWRNK
jgi:hypothetical protein